MYEKDFLPIQGRLSEDKKSVIIQNYRSGSKVRIKVEYEDGTVDEFVRSPCYIDPVISYETTFPKRSNSSAVSIWTFTKSPIRT